MQELRFEVKQSCFARFNITSQIKILEFLEHLHWLSCNVMHHFILRHIFLSKLQRHKHLLLAERDVAAGLHGLSGLLSHGAGDVDWANRDGGGSSELELLFGGARKIHSDYFKSFL